MDQPDTLYVDAMRTIFKFATEESKELRVAMSKLLLDWDTTGLASRNEEKLENLMPILNKYVGKIYPNEIYPPKLTKDAIRTIFNSQHVNNVIRTMKVMREIFIDSDIPEDDMIVYLNELSLSNGGRVNLYKMSKSVRDKLLDNNRKLFENLDKTQIDILLNFTPEGLKILSDIIDLPDNQKSFLFSVSKEESEVYEALEPKRIRLLLSLEDDAKFEILNLTKDHRNKLKNDDNERRQFLQNLGLFDVEHDMMDLLGLMVHLNEEEFNALYHLINENGHNLLDLNEKAEKVMSKIKDLHLKDRHLYLNLESDEKAALKRLIGGNVDDLIATTSNLNEKFLTLIRSFKKHQIKSMMRLGDERFLSTLAYVSPQGQSHLKKITAQLGHQESLELLNLSSEQRLLLSKVYHLRDDGIELAHELTREKLHEVLEATKGKTNLLDHFNLRHLTLFKIISNLNPDDRAEIIDLTRENWTEFFNINKDFVLNLSVEGRTVLKQMGKFTQEQLQIIEKLSNNGISVLATNHNLNPEDVIDLNKLAVEEGRCLLNLTLEQRSYLRHTRERLWNLEKLFNKNSIKVVKNLSSNGRKVLMRMTRLTADEAFQLERLTAVEKKAIHHANSANIFSSLSQEEIKQLANVFDYRVEKELVFRVWEILFQPDRDYPQIQLELKDYLEDALKYTEEDPFISMTNYMKLIASTTAVSQFNDNRPIFEDVIGTIDHVDGPISASMFAFFMLNYPTNDLPVLLSKIPNDELTTTHLGSILNYKEDQDVLFLRWMLNYSLMQNDERFYNIARTSLFMISMTVEPWILDNIVSIVDGLPNDNIRKALQQQLTSHDYELGIEFYLSASRYSKNTYDDTLVAKWLSDLLKSDDCHNMLKSIVTPELLDRNHLNLGVNLRRNILEESSLNEPNVFDCSVYYNQGDPVPLVQRLNDQEFFALLNRHSKSLINLAIKFGQVRLLRYISEKIGNESMRDYIRMNNGRIMENFQSFEHVDVSDILGTIKWIREIDPDFDKIKYHGLIKSYILSVQSRVSPEELGLLLDSLITDETERTEILQQIDNQLIPECKEYLIKQIRPSCSNRSKRDLSFACKDSKDDEDMKLTKQRAENLFNEFSDGEFYQQLLQLSEGNRKDLIISEPLKQKILSVDLNKIKPLVANIIKELRVNINKKQQIYNILKRTDVIRKIGQVASGVGLFATIFMVGEHVLKSDVIGLSFDTLNLWVLPKTGENLMKRMAVYAERSGSNFFKHSSPAAGRFIGNFMAFLGLAEALMERSSAVNYFDKELADLNIMTNSIFIMADLPALAVETLETFNMAVGVLGEIAGPIGVAVSVAVILVSNIISTHLQYEKLNAQIRLTDRERREFYWDSVTLQGISKDIEHDILAEEIYKTFITDILKKFQKRSHKIGLTLPSISIKKIIHESTEFQRNFRWSRVINKTRESIEEIKMNATDKSYVYNPFSSIDDQPLSRLLPNITNNYRLVCGPTVKDVRINTLNDTILSLAPDGLHNPNIIQSKLREITQRWYIPQDNDKCRNMILYEKLNTKSFKVFFYSLQDIYIESSNTQSIELMNYGQRFTVVEREFNKNLSRVMHNKYHVNKDLKRCEIYKGGINYLHTKTNNLAMCKFGGVKNNQINVAVVDARFQDSKNIHGILGRTNSNTIHAKHAQYVDGQGGGDTIFGTNLTTIVGHFGDRIHGPAIVLLPITVQQIYKIVCHENLQIFCNKNQWIIVDREALVKTADGFFISPMKWNRVNFQVTHLHVHKTLSSNNLTFDVQLERLKQLKHPHIGLTKQLFWPDYDIVLADRYNSIFHTDKDHCNFYWKASSGTHLYAFDKIHANVSISEANGILDLRKLNKTHNDSSIKMDNDNQTTIDIENLRITLLANRKNLKVTYDGEAYYRLKNDRLERDYCSHVLKVATSIQVDANDLYNHHNCFEFRSDKVLFLRDYDNLIVKSSRGLISIKRYYTLAHRKLDLSVKLNHMIIDPDKFQRKAERPNNMKYYQLDESNKLLIYHNQPNNENHVGLIDFQNISIFHCAINFVRNDLFLSYRDDVILKIKNWKIYDPARQIMFAFEDTVIFNDKCFLSYCEPEEVFHEFHRERFHFVNNQRSRNKRDATIPTNIYDGGSKLEGIQQIDYHSTNKTRYYFDQFHQNNCIVRNVGLIVFFVHHFIDKKYPMPKSHSMTPAQIMADSVCITNKFERLLKMTAKEHDLPVRGVDFPQLSSDVANHIRNESYSQILEAFYSVARTISDDSTFLDTLRPRIGQLMKRL